MSGRARVLAGLVVALAALVADPDGEEAASAAQSRSPRPGVAPDGLWTCPATHPIKGYLSQSGGRLYFVPASPFYDEANPERCYRTEDEARRDGAAPARGWGNIYPLV